MHNKRNLFKYTRPRWYSIPRLPLTTISMDDDEKDVLDVDDAVEDDELEEEPEEDEKDY